MPDENKHSETPQDSTPSELQKKPSSPASTSENDADTERRNKVEASLKELEKNLQRQRLPRPKTSSLPILFIVLSVFLLIMLFGQTEFPSAEGELKPGDFWEKLESGVLKTAKMEGNEIRGEFQEGDAREYRTILPIPYLVEGKKYSPDLQREIPMIDYIISKVGKEHWTYAETDPVFLQLLSIFGPWFLIFIFVYFFFIRGMRNNGGMGGGVLSFGRSRAKLHLKERTGVTFKDVAGVEEAKMDVMEIVEFLKNPSKFQRLGGRIPRGVLLVGSPGCGKTLLAKAIAGEADVPFYSISGSDFVEMFVGVGASRVRDLFKQAKENSPCLIFLDEIDAVGRKRGGMGGGGQEEREQTLNAILVEMDGFDSDSGIVLIAATNRPDILDPALLRPGRFDRHVVIMLPDVRGREEILKVHAKKVKISPEVDLQVLARSTPGFSGADLAALINESALLAALHDKEGVEEEDLEEARDKVRWGRQREGSFKLMDEKEKEITAYHEAGHAVIAASLDNMDPLYKVTIIPRGMALGATMQLPEKDQYHYGKKKLEGRLCIAFGGRLAEEIFCDDITTGASDDIRRATEMARKMVTEWGMSEKIGPIHYGTKERQEFLGTEVEGPRNYSELQAQRIDEEVQNILFSAQKDARHLIEEHREGLEKVARNLMKYEVLTGMEVLKLLKGESIDEERLHAQRLKEEKTRHLSEQRQVKQELEKEEEEPLPTKEKQGVKD